jgi:hypothetical protein
MEGFCFVTPITGVNRPNPGKEDDDDEKKFTLSDDMENKCGTLRT